MAAGIGWGAIGLIAAIGPATWQQLDGVTSPEVAAIRNRSGRCHRYCGRTADRRTGRRPRAGVSLQSGGTDLRRLRQRQRQDRDVLALKPGDTVSIIYAATMPNVSCLDGSTDCPNDVYDPAIPAFGFWAVLIVGSLLGCAIVGIILIARKSSRHRRAT